MAVVIVASALLQLACGGEDESPARAARPVVVWAIGDGADGGDAARRVAAVVARDRPARVLYLGDVYDRGTLEEFRENFGEPYERFLRRMLPTPGNHDWPAHEDGYEPFWRSVRGKPFAPWYATRIGAWQVLSLNSEAPHGPSSPQMRWLERQLERPARCLLAFWHRPRFNAGAHGDQEDIEPLWEAVAGHAELVLNGHDHNLQRMRPIDGTMSLVIGAGGHGRYPVDDDDRRLAFAEDDRYGALRMELDGDGARLRIVAEDGTVLDRSQVRCR